MTVYDVIVIGSGAAGYTATIYACRAGRRTLLVAGSLSGGQLMLTSEVENYPGFADPILGPELMQRMRIQAEKFGPDIVFDDVTKVDFTTRPFTVRVGNEPRQGRTIIIATGAYAKWLGLSSEEKFRGRGVSTCATCDGYFFKGKNVVVVGGGDTAMEEATFLANITNHVTVVHRRDSLKASKIMQERASRNPKIDFVWDSVVTDVLGDDHVTGVRIRNLKSGSIRSLKVDGLFVAIGYQPNTEVFKGHVQLDEKGYVLTHDGTRTSVQGVFAAGDVQDHKYRQAVTAAADGCKAAIDADRYLLEYNEQQYVGLPQH